MPRASRSAERENPGGYIAGNSDGPSQGWWESGEQSQRISTRVDGGTGTWIPATYALDSLAANGARALLLLANLATNRASQQLNGRHKQANKVPMLRYLGYATGCSCSTLCTTTNPRHAPSFKPNGRPPALTLSFANHHPFPPYTHTTASRLRFCIQ